jgi:hypothetical protein
MHRCACAICSPTTNTFCTWRFWEMRFIWSSVVTVIKETHLTGRQGCQKSLRIFSFRPWLACTGLPRGIQPVVQELKCRVLHERVLSFHLVLCSSGGRDSSVGMATGYGAGRPGVRFPIWERFSANVQAGPEAHAAWSFPEVKRPGSGVDHPPAI